MHLTELQIKAARTKTKPYNLYDNGGLYIQISVSGSKLWRLKYYFGGKEKRCGLGKWPDVSLKEARLKRDEIRLALERGENPRLKKHIPVLGTFRDLAEDWKTRKAPEWSENHLRTVIQRLERYIYPILGDIPPGEISPQQVLLLVRGLEDRGAVETAHRVLGICSLVLRYGVILGVVASDPCRDLRGALRQRQAVSFPAITDPVEVGELMRGIDAYTGSPVVRYALEFSALTFCRPGEIRQAEWGEFDFDRALWTIPAEKMKLRKAHLVPLSRQALRIIEEVKLFTASSRFVFPNARSFDRPLSEAAVTAALAGMGYKGRMTAHGFRAMASTLLNERGHRHDVIEAQLAHAGYDKIRAVYNRAEYMEERRRLMQEWADYLDGLREAIPRA